MLKLTENMAICGVFPKFKNFVLQQEPAVVHDGVSVSICTLSLWAYVAWMDSVTVA